MRENITHQDYVFVFSFYPHYLSQAKVMLYNTLQVLFTGRCPVSDGNDVGIKQILDSNKCHLWVFKLASTSHSDTGPTIQSEKQGLKKLVSSWLSVVFGITHMYSLVIDIPLILFFVVSILMLGLFSYFC